MITDASVVARTYEVFNSRDFDGYDELLAEDVELVMSGVTLRGLTAVKDFITLTTQARPGLQIVPQRVFQQTGDTVVTEVLMMDTGSSASSDGRPLEAWACGLYRLAGGRITEWRIYHDPVGEELAATVLITTAAEQTALRRVAELIARSTSLDEIFPVVTSEIMRLLGIDHVRAARFEADKSATVIAAHGFSPDVFGVGEHPPTGGGTSLGEVLRTGSAARIDDYRAVAGESGETLRGAEVGDVAAAPIVVEGKMWGGLVVAATADHKLPPQTQASMAQFADLLSMAISNAEARASVERLAADQSALQRVATLVAREVALDEFFPALAREIRVLLDVDAVVITRSDGQRPAALVAIDGDGSSLPFEWEQIHAEPDLDSTSSAIFVDRDQWGQIAIATRSPKLIPFDATRRLNEFGQQASRAIAGANRRADLIASRARIIQAGDAARRRVERDLHDGAQQQLISIGLELQRLAQDLPDRERTQERLSALSTRLDDALEGLRELSHGLHPTVLFDGGLTSAVRTLVRRNAIPVDLRLALRQDRYAEPVEVAAYYVISEALANVTKHAQAAAVTVELRDNSGRLELTVRDEGRGGADPSHGTGLTGLRDRVEAIGGTFRLISPAAGGTTIEVRLPLTRSS